MRSIFLPPLLWKSCKKIFTKLTVAESPLEMYVLPFQKQTGIYLVSSQNDKKNLLTLR